VFRRDGAMQGETLSSCDDGACSTQGLLYLAVSEFLFVFGLSGCVGFVMVLLREVEVEAPCCQSLLLDSSLDFHLLEEVEAVVSLAAVVKACSGLEVPSLSVQPCWWTEAATAKTSVMALKVSLLARAVLVQERWSGRHTRA
jgi:hypothetical protein